MPNFGQLCSKTVPYQLNRVCRMNFNFSASCVYEATKGVWWMPWRQVPMKDVVHCDKPREVVCRRYIRGCPNGETHVSKPRVSHAEHIGMGGEPGELKHLSTQRKRDYSASSGERTRISPNHPCLHGWGCRAQHMRVTNQTVRRMLLERATAEGDSPVGEN